jgi:hypothetical protein
MSKYTIGFNHTSTKESSSLSVAKRIVRVEARVQKRFGSAPRLRYVEGCDGTYIYTSTAAAKADADGSRAFAVISRL